MSYLAGILMVGILVFIHESGHFLVAKALGMGVRTFSLGFGARLWGFRIGETDYRISALPIGGYVRLTGADPFGHELESEDDEDPRRSYANRPVWQRLAVMAAGPAFNIILPIVVFTALLMSGEPQPRAEVGRVAEGTPAAAAGVEAGDLIHSINGAPVLTWYDVAQSLSPGQHSLELEGRAGRRTVQLTVPPEGETTFAERTGLENGRPGTVVGIDDPRSPAGAAGMRTGDRITAVNGQPVENWLELEAILRGHSGALQLSLRNAAGESELRLQPSEWRPVDAEVDHGPAAAWGLLPGTLFIEALGTSTSSEAEGFGGCSSGPPPAPTPADQAGLRRGDRFLRLDGHPVRYWSDVTRAVRGALVGDIEGGQVRAMKVEVVREGQVLSMEVTPRVIRSTNELGVYVYRPMLGVLGAGEQASSRSVKRHYSFAEAFPEAVHRTRTLSLMILDIVGKLFTGQADVSKTTGGPVELLRQARDAAEMGLFYGAQMLGQLSLSVGIVNLLPVPVLDGGHILFLALEAIRGRPVSPRVRERALQVGVLFIAMLLLFLTADELPRLIMDIYRSVTGG